MHRQEADGAEQRRVRALPLARPAPASATGGRPGRGLAASTKYEAAQTIAISAQTTPAGARSAPETRSRTRTRPSAARPAPATVSGPGRSPWRSQSQTTTAAGAVYSISSAGPTSMRSHGGEVGELRAGDRARRRTRARTTAFARSAPHRPRSARAASGRDDERARSPGGRERPRRRSSRRRAGRARAARTARTTPRRRPRAPARTRAPGARAVISHASPWPMTIGDVG